jgi:chemotaxis protein MotA
MDLASIIGVVGALLVVVAVMIMDGGSPLELVSNPSAILLTVGGSLMATFVTTSMKNFLTLPKLLGIAFKETHFGEEEAIESLARMADKARREGLLALEEESKKIKDPFLQKGIMLVVDGVDPAQVKAILETQIHHMEERHASGYGLFGAAGGFAPTFGIIGTVMGLISVLKELDNPAKLAKSIASAFLATLWGLLISNLIYLPINAKLKAKDAEETAYRHLLLEGILSLQAGENPRIVREKLLAFLPPSVARKAEAEAEKGKAGA